MRAFVSFGRRCVLVTALLGFCFVLAPGPLIAQDSASVDLSDDPYVVVLGIAQDGGFPQAGCQRECCAFLKDHPEAASGPACLAIVDPGSGERWMLECTPDFSAQLAALDSIAPRRDGGPLLDGILLTHAHIGHYAGLIHLGREVIGAKSIPVFAMPRMREFLSANGPWSQLVSLDNIELVAIEAETSFHLNARIRVVPIVVPHRDEFSETVGFVVHGPTRSILFLPDIDKWDRWGQRIEDVVGEVDRAYLDATFFDESELPGRSMAEIPHPFVVETMKRFQGMSGEQRSKVHLIHFNHSNPALHPGSEARLRIDQFGMGIAAIGERLGL